MHTHTYMYSLNIYPYNLSFLIFPIAFFIVQSIYYIIIIPILFFVYYYYAVR